MMILFTMRMLDPGCLVSSANMDSLTSTRRGIFTSNRTCV
jgi:hypothetical protein